MTYCLGIKIQTGIVAISDTRLTSGNETSTAEKYKIYSKNNQNVFVMTSGLRSLRDKALTYFSDVFEDNHKLYSKLYQVVNAFGEQIKQVAEEDKESLEKAGLSFNIHTIVGGQLKGDAEHKLFLLYPEGNWIEIESGSPYTIIGNSGYGKPVLKRTIKFDSTIRFALKTGFLSFDSTRVSTNDVNYPIDVIIYDPIKRKLKVHRYEHSDLQAIGKLWGEKLTQAVHDMPDDWMDAFLNEID